MAALRHAQFDPSIRPLRRLDSLDFESNCASNMTRHSSRKVLTKSLILQLAFQSIGVVYGDVGTSPLYVFSGIFPNGIGHQSDVLGAMALVFYTLTIVPLIKYVFIVLYANDNGDGGTFALYSLICRHANGGFRPNQQAEDREVSNYTLQTPSKKFERAMKVREIIERSYVAKTVLLILALVGTSLLIGDGVLTPSISVLSAVSGIQQASPNLTLGEVVIIAIVILIALFSVQRLGTSKVGFMFAPAVLLWFAFIGSIGISNIAKYDPRIFRACNPVNIYLYFKRNKTNAWISLGGVVLAITGTEAMFADVGHFSVPSIQIAFSFVVYPCLLLAYFGQAAYLMKYPQDVANTFYKSIPTPVYWPMFVVAVAAAIIASQAMISATFTIVKQSMSLYCFPQVEVIHTSSKVAGQIYIPILNWILMIACIIVTAGFQTTIQIGNAYGIAVVGVMVVTTSLLTLIMILIWHTRLIFVIGFLLLFGSVDLLYLSSVLYKFREGGYLPIAFSGVLLFIMYVWHYVSIRRYFYEVENKVSPEALANMVPRAQRLPGVALLYNELVQGVPGIFSHMMDNLPALHSVVVFVSVKVLPVTTIFDEERFLVRRVGPRNYHLYRCVVRYGYMDLQEENESFERRLLTKLHSFISCEEIDVSDMRQESQEDAALEMDATSGEAIENHNNEESESVLREEVFSRKSSSMDCKLPNSGPMLGEMRLQELRFLQEAKDAGVVYLLGNSEVRAQNNSPLLRRWAINYVYSFLKRNFQSSKDALIIPHQKMLEVGMIYYV